MNDILDPAILLGAENLLFDNDNLVDVIGILAEEGGERENHERVRNFFEEVIPLYSLSGKYNVK